MSRGRRKPMAVGSLILLLTLPWLASCSHTENRVTEPDPPAGGIDAEEYVVYGTMLDTRVVAHGGKHLVIQDSTVTEYIGGFGPESLGYLQQNMPGLEEETFNDLLAKTETGERLEDRFELAVPVTLLTDQDLDEIFSEGGWNEFYHLYPNAAGLLELSRVGLNEAGDQALVYLGQMFEPLAGAGYMILLEKRDGAWMITDSVMMWIS